jgi:hypothetical protein
MFEAVERRVKVPILASNCPAANCKPVPTETVALDASETPWLLLICNISNWVLPLMVCALLPLRIAVPLPTTAALPEVPPVQLPHTLRLWPLSVRVAPWPKVILPTLKLAVLIIGVAGALIITSAEQLFGTPAGDQLLAKFQSPLVAPTHVLGPQGALNVIEPDEGYAVDEQPLAVRTKLL